MIPLLFELVLAAAAAAATPAATPPAAATTPAAPPPAALENPAAAPGVFAPTDRIKIAVMALGGGDDVAPDLLTALGTAIPKALDLLGAFEAVSSQELTELVTYQAARQRLGDCDEPDCLAQVGGVLGADYLLTGALTKAGDAWVLQLQLTHVASAKVEAREQRRFSGDAAGLFDELSHAVRVLVRGLLELRSGYLALRASEEGATVRVDGTIVGVTPLGALQVAGGTHTVEVQKEGFVAYRLDVTIEEKKVSSLEAQLIPSADYVAAYRRDAELVRTLAWSGIGGGAGLLAGAAALFAGAEAEAQALDRAVQAFNARGDRPSSEAQQLDGRRSLVGTMDVLTLGFAAAGAAALAAGIGLRLLGPDPGRYDALTRVLGGSGDAALPRLQLGATRVGLAWRF